MIVTRRPGRASALGTKMRSSPPPRRPTTPAMTFCLAMTVEDGLVGLSDTRVTTGSEVISAKKVSVYDFPPLREDAGDAAARTGPAGRAS